MTIETILRAVLREELQTMLKPQQAAPPSPAPLSIEENLALTVQEAAEFSSYTAETLMERIRSRDLPAHKPKGSREWRIRFGDLTDWLWRSEKDSPKVMDIGELSVMMRGRSVAR